MTGSGHEFDREEADIVAGLSLQCRLWGGASFLAAAAYVVAFARMSLPAPVTALMVVGAVLHTALGVLYARGGSHLGLVTGGAGDIPQTMSGVRNLSRALFLQAAAGVVGAIALFALIGGGAAR